MSAKSLRTIRFFLGVGCVVVAVIGAVEDMLRWYYFAVLFAGGCGLMGQKSIWEKICFILRGKS